MTVAAPLQPEDKPAEDKPAEDKRQARLDAVRAIVLEALGGCEARVWFAEIAARSGNAGPA